MICTIAYVGNKSTQHFHTEEPTYALNLSASTKLVIGLKKSSFFKAYDPQQRLQPLFIMRRDVENSSISSFRPFLDEPNSILTEEEVIRLEQVHACGVPHKT